MTTAQLPSPVLPTPTPAKPVRPSHTVLAVGLILLYSAFNLGYIAIGCPIDLSPDEAHYWDWARHPDWCYYSKGPVVAWLICGSCELFGHMPFAVRLPAVVCGGLLLAGLWRLAADTTRDPRFALGVLLLAVTLPPFTVSSVLMTIDPPFLACWAWAAVAVRHRRWLAAGGLVAVGILTKQTMLLFPACVGLLMLARPEWRTRRFVPFLALSALGLVPLAAWNATHDWVGVRHLLGHAGVNGKPTPWYSPLAFVGGQAGLLLGVWFAAWAVGVWRFRPTRVPHPDTALLWWLSAPVFAAFLVVSLFSTGQANWPAAAYVSGLVLAGRVAWTTHARMRPWHRSAALAGAVLLGLGLSAAVRWPNLVRPALAAVLPAPTEQKPFPVRQLDPTARLAGWRELAAAVDRVRRDVRDRTGEDPLVAAMVWTVPGELGFYCDGHPTVYSFGSALGDRASQYDLWRPNPVDDAQEFAGRTFVYVGYEPPAGMFDRAEMATDFRHAEGGVPLVGWQIWVGEGYRGAARSARPRY